MRDVACTVLFALAVVSLAACRDGDVPVPPATTAERRCAPGENLQECGKNLVIAHRGGAKLWPEETMLAFENAVKAGADVLELDVHATEDGVVICMHDAEVDRTTDGTGLVKEKTFAEIEALDAGAKFEDGDGQTPYKGKGLKVATLQEVLGAFPEMPFSIEIKQVEPSIVDAVIAIIEAAGVSGQTVVASFDGATLDDVRAKRPELATSLSAPEIIDVLQVTEATLADYTLPAPVFQAPIDAITEERMRVLQGLEMRVHVWTVDDREDMERMWNLGVHGIMSDDPVLLKTVTAELGRDSDKGL